MARMCPGRCSKLFTCIHFKLSLHPQEVNTVVVPILPEEYGGKVMLGALV